MEKNEERVIEVSYLLDELIEVLPVLIKSGFVPYSVIPFLRTLIEENIK